LPILQQAYYSWATIKGGEEFLRDTMELLDQPILINDNEPVKELVSFNNNITLDSVSFRYNTDSPLVINNMSLTIPKGARVGIIGVTGSGKSTVLDIIMSLLKPSSGNLMIDGVNISHENYRSWQAHIAHVPQSIYLADATILENIAFGIALDEIDFDRVKEAAYKAQIAETIESWDNKYLTKVGERGVRLSGGQRQRIGIARALYKKADVIIFDEATSALDNLTENEVMSAIENLGTNLTIIIVAHRLTTLKSCSKIFELEAGNVINIRSYNEILEKQNKS
jgi:ATP-binding cassette subfamily B protein